MLKKPPAFLKGYGRQASGDLAIVPTFGLTDLPLFAAFALTYRLYAPRVKVAVALFFKQSLKRF